MIPCFEIHNLDFNLTMEANIGLSPFLLIPIKRQHAASFPKMEYKHVNMCHGMYIKLF